MDISQINVLAFRKLPFEVQAEVHRLLYLDCYAEARAVYESALAYYQRVQQDEDRQHE